MSRHRVLILNERCHRHPQAGGVELTVFEIFSRLHEHVETELLCSGFAGSSRTDEHRGITITRLGHRLSFYAKLPGEVRRRIAAGQVDLIVEELSKVPFLSPLWAPRIPKLILHHHLHGRTAFRQVGAPLAASACALEATLPLLYRRLPFLTVSDSSRTDLVHRGIPEEQIDIVPNGIDHELHRPADIEGRSPIIVSVGRLEPYKRIDLLVKAMPYVLASEPTARLVIVGRGQAETPLRALAGRLRLDHAVTFTGYVSDREKVTWLQRAALLVQCSRKEGWGLSVFEAYACGTPVVAARVPGLTDSVQDGITGHLVHKARPATLAAAITRLLNHEDERVELARRAEAWVQSFSWDRTAARTLRAIRAAIASQRAPISIPSLSPTAPVREAPALPVPSGGS